MRNLIIDNLSEQDKEQPGYLAVKSRASVQNALKFENGDKIIEYLEQLNTDYDSISLTFLSHGHKRGITAGSFITLVTWCELYECVNKIRTRHPVILNLSAVCTSERFFIFPDNNGIRIDYILYTTSETISLSKCILAIEESSIEDWYAQLEENDKLIYKIFELKRYPK